MKLPKPILLASIAAVLFAVFLFLNNAPVRVHLLVVSDVLPVYAVILVGFGFGMLSGLGVGYWLLRRRAPGK